MSIIAWLILSLLIVFLLFGSIQTWRLRPRQSEEYERKEKHEEEAQECNMQKKHAIYEYVEEG